MALEDRERNFEKALKRELRANGAGGFDCPDSETLAAYHERMLSPEEMTAQKTHIAACPRCQEILATLEVTEAVPTGAEDSEKVPVKALELAGARAKSASVREMPKRKLYLRWALPAGAIAAGLLVWIAINSSRPAMMMKQSAPVTVAENREQKEATASVAKPATSAPSSQMSDKLAENERIATKQDSDAFAMGGLAKSQGKTQDEAMSRGRASTVAPRAYGPGPRQMQNQTNQAQNQMLYRTQNDGQILAQDQATELDKVAGAPVTGKNAATLEQNAPRRNEQAAKAAPAPPPAQAPSPANAAGAAGDRADTDANAKRELNKDQKAGVTTQAPEATAEARSDYAEEKAGDKSSVASKKLKETQNLGIVAGNLRDVSANGLQFIQTPDGKVLWFFTATGTVFRSEDGGKTTRPQKIGEGIKFIAGSAPDGKTCWLLAQGNVVFRTVDGGKHWWKGSTPKGVEFSTIVATDGEHAAISAMNGTVTVTTADGGTTWSAAGKP